MKSNAIQPLNYSAHAIEDLREVAKAFQRGGIATSAARLNHVVSMLQSSVKFILPNRCDLIAPEDFKQSHLDLMKLPYPCVAFEAPWELDGDLVQIGDFAQSPAPKRIALCWEILPDLPEILPGFSEPLSRCPDGGVAVLPIYWGSHASQWCVGAGGIFIPYGTTITERVHDPKTISGMATLALEEAGLAPKSQKAFQADPFVLFPELFAHCIKEFGSVEQAMVQVTIDARDEAGMLVQACSVINCSNVHAIDLAPSASLNKKRMEKGKQPFFSYKVLQLSEDKGKSGQQGAGGSHASPRMHLRRGHLRRLENKVIWVKPTMVNADATHGIVAKQYGVT